MTDNSAKILFQSFLQKTMVSSSGIGIPARPCPTRWTYWQNSHRKCLERKIGSVWEVEALLAGTKPRSSHHRPPGGERRSN